MVKVKLSTGEVEILLTDLYNEKLFTTEDLKYLYGLRWGIATAYGKQKDQQQMEQFSGHRVIWASLKHNIVKLFLQNEPEEILLQLQEAFERNIEPIRPGRHNPRIRKAKRLNGKYQTFTNYKRAI